MVNPAPRPADKQKLEATFAQSLERARGALSAFLHTDVPLKVTHLDFLPVEAAAELVGHPERVVASVLLKIQGEINGHAVVLFPEDAALLVAGRLLGKEKESDAPFSPMAVSALKELGNVLLGTLLSTLADTFRLHVVGSVPGFALDMARAATDIVMIELGRVSDSAFAVRVEFSAAPFTAEFLLFLDKPSLERLLTHIRSADAGH